MSDDLLFLRGPDDPQEKTYLGDGVYAAHDGFQIWISLQTGDTIALEPAVMNNLIAYQKHLQSRRTGG